MNTTESQVKSEAANLFAKRDLKGLKCLFQDNYPKVREKEIEFVSGEHGRLDFYACQEDLTEGEYISVESDGTIFFFAWAAALLASHNGEIFFTPDNLN